MGPQDLFERGWWIGTTVLAGIGAWALGRLRRDRSERQLQMKRLAAEIVEVARSIEADLTELPRTSDVADLARRCAECRRRTSENANTRLKDDALEEAIGRLHDDHRRAVDLRSEVDVLMVAHRSGQPSSRELRFAPSSRARGSRFATTSLLTRPSTLG